MDNKLHNDAREDEDDLVFQNLTPEKTANAFQKSIIHLQQNWPPHLNKRHQLLLVTVLSSLLVFCLIFAFIHISRQPNNTLNVITSNSSIAAITTNVSQILPYGNVLYVIVDQISHNNGTLEALSARTGTLMWSYTHHNAKEIQLVKNILYIQSDTNLVALNAATRTLLWEKQNLSDNDGWQIDQGILFAVSTAIDGIVTALNASTGVQLWQSKQPNSFWQADSGIFYITPRTGLGLRALNAHTGKQLWYNPHIYQDLTMDNGNFYLQDTGKQRIEAFNGSNGKMLWQLATHGEDFTLAADSGFLLLSDIKETSVEVTNDQTGKLLWQRQGSINALPGSPNQVVISSRQKNETDIIRTSDGTILYHFPGTDALLSLENGIAFFLYYPSNDSTQNVGDNFLLIDIEAVRIINGAPIWSHQTREEFTQLQNNTIGIVPIDNNVLLLLRADDGHTLWQHQLDTSGG